jgi:putative molybdopterin biosynthesis protein
MTGRGSAVSGAAVTRAGFVPAGGLADGTVAEQSPPARSLPPGSWPSGPSSPTSSPGGQQPVRWVQPFGPPRPTLVVAGCDPALPLLEALLSLLDPPVAFAWWPCGSGEALGLAAEGSVHVAGAHLRGRSGDYNTGPAGELLRQGAEVIGFCSWREGLVLRPELAASLTGVADLERAGLRVVNREPGSEARRVLDRELADHGLDPGQLPGYQTQATGHLHVAAAIAAGLADAGVASEPAALAYGLAFVPLASERFDLVIPADFGGSREVQGLLKVLSSPWLLDQLASLPGYDASRCGRHIATVPPGVDARA